MKIHFRMHSVKSLRTLLRNDGQDLVEYALLLALLAFGLVAGVNSLASKMTTMFSSVGDFITSHTG